MYDEYSKYLDGKRVCIVGPSPSLIGKKEGELIDSFDIVVRVNHGWPPPVEIDLGKRTDVIYHLMAGGRVKRTVVNKKEILQKAHDDGVKWIVSVHSDKTRAGNNNRFKNINGGDDGLVKFRTVDYVTRDEVKKAVKSSPNSGIIAIKDLLIFKICELYITGYTFYRDGYYGGYGAFKEGATKVGARGGQHNQDNHIAYFQDLYRADARIRVDKRLEQIIGVVRNPRRKINLPMDLIAQKSFIYKGTMMHRGSGYRASRSDALSHIRRGMAREKKPEPMVTKEKMPYAIVHRGGPWFDVMVGELLINEQPIKGKVAAIEEATGYIKDVNCEPEEVAPAILQQRAAERR